MQAPSWWELVPGKDYSLHSIWEGALPSLSPPGNAAPIAQLTCGQMILTVGLPGALVHL